MFLDKTIKTNPKLINTSFKLHQENLILPDTYVIDLDVLLKNAQAIYEQAKSQNIEPYFMLKQLGRNPYIAHELVKLGYKGAVVVDFREAQVMMKHQIPIANVGHLVQIPKALLQELVDYGSDYFTVFSIQKAKELNECAKKSNKRIKLMLKVVGPKDMIYSGQSAGFKLEELANVYHELKACTNIEISGVTSFPCFLYDNSYGKIMPTANFFTLQKAKAILEECGCIIDNVNAPSTSSLDTLAAMKGYDVNSIEPGHGLSGTIPLHANVDSVELPCVTYVSEISHNFNGNGYCYGGGHYRRSHVSSALVGYDYEHSQRVKVIPPSDESIDYYFGIDQPCEVNQSVIMAFRYQIFVTRANVCIVAGIQSDLPKIIATYSSLGELL